MFDFPKALKLTCGAWTAAVLPHFGMNAVSLRCADKAVLREPQDMRVLEENPHVYGIPLLFPANRTAGGRFEFHGRTYTLPLNEPARHNHIHGLLYNAPFTVKEQTESSVTAVYENTGERYPFPFTAEITDTLSENGLHRTLRLKNTGSGDLPYTLAFHTAFTAPQYFTAPIKARFLCNEMYIPTGEMTGLTAQEQRYTAGSTADDLRISGFYASCGSTAMLDDIRFTVSENFDEWVLFNAGGGQGFLCIEPQCGEVNGLNTPSGHRVLKRGEEERFTLFIGREERL